MEEKLKEKLNKAIQFKIKYYVKEMNREEYQVKIHLYDGFIHELRELQEILNQHHTSNDQ